jgi:hypothetical protein
MPNSLATALEFRSSFDLASPEYAALTALIDRLTDSNVFADADAMRYALEHSR